MDGRPRRRAFLLGCNSESLEHCETDAATMQRALERCGGWHIVCCTSSQLHVAGTQGPVGQAAASTPVAIVAQRLRAFLKDCARGDTAVFYFSGHSLYDGEVFNLVVGQDVNDTDHLWNIEEVVGLFKQARKAAERLLILDCCEAGQAASLDGFWNTAAGTWGRIWVATRANEHAQELDGETHGGLFTALIDRALTTEAPSLAEEGRLTVNRADEFVGRWARAYASTHPKPAPQPGLYGNARHNILLADGLTAVASTSVDTRPLSQCPDLTTQSLSDALDAARAEEERLICEGADTREVQTRILDLKRRIREGGRLCVGDDLLDGRYKLIDTLGRGGFATIFKAFDGRARRLVAVKVLHGQHGDERGRVERFFRGARKMAELRHQGIVQVFDSDLADEGHHFFVMEYLPGGDLRQAVLNGVVAPESALDLILTVGAALAFAHARGIIHRDIKPANIVLDAAGLPKLTDFDLVRAVDTTGGTVTGMMGTYVYAAPELMDHPQDADARADVFGLGMTAIFALHRQDLRPRDMLRNPEGFIARLTVAAAVKSVLCRAIAWDLEERYESVESFCAALREARRAGEPASVASRTGPVDAGAMPVSPANAADPKPIPGLRDRLKDGTAGPAMVWLPGETFIMGQDDSAHDDEKPAHPVRVDACSIGQYPVTFAEYDRFCAATERAPPADQGWGRGERPAINVSWDDAQAYCAWLSEQTGERYALATEAQWEYACRAGSTSRWSCGDDESALGDHAWYLKNAGGKTQPVGGKQRNAWHLYDMQGNVWEWCQDWWSTGYYKQLATVLQSHAAAAEATGTQRSASDIPLPASENPTGPQSGSIRVCRGGAWCFGADICRSAYRYRRLPSGRDNDLGFRLSRTGPWPSYPLTLVGAASPKVPEPAAKPRLTPDEVFRDASAPTPHPSHPLQGGREQEVPAMADCGDDQADPRPAVTTMSQPPAAPPRVFISYAQCSDAHSRRVLALAQALVAQGIDSDLDQFHQHELLDWPRWCGEQLRPDRSDWVLMVCSAAYRDRLENRVDPHTGKGAFWEGALIDDEIYGAKENRRFVPVLLDDEPQESIPSIVRGWTFCRVTGLDMADPGYEALYRLLTRQPAAVKGALGSVTVLGTAPGRRESAQGTQTAPGAPSTSPGGRALEQALALLGAQHEAALMQSVTAIDAVTQEKARQQAEEIERKIDGLARRLDRGDRP
ncbi:SUMF1/EgtB/PvdO family nonheme iron enzyme [uncultured Thiodictyon sp.]|uniref:SUMF1/EgtB/PvdO family nonheme iron enzyme n=1 Tax=uncultured Thiodictyon sp. TaxID=1846217 RepID=UPI0025EDF7D3|nr:SUMF1/EgtB/PvdO family nonheme iron enzyme [uncultured Thiodictyon sp.]